MVSGVWTKTKGMRACQDIIEEALAQEWTVKEAKSGHIFLIPPNPEGVPVGISNTPSDVHQRHQVIRQMKKSGFRWPPPPMEGKKVSNNGDVMCNVDIINAAIDQGWTMDTSKPTARLVPASSNQPCILLPANNDTRTRYIFLQSLRRSGLKWPWHAPMTPENAVPDSNQEPVEEAPHNQEEPVVMMAEPEVTTQQEESTPTWVKIMDQQWADGFWVSDNAEVKAPGGSIRKGNVNFDKPDKHPIVGIQRRSGLDTTTRMDKLVLTAFRGPAEGREPVHLDGKNANCVLSNLEWGAPPVKRQGVTVTLNGEAKGGGAGSTAVVEASVEEAVEPIVEAKKDDVLGIEDLELTKRTQVLLGHNGIWNTGDLTSWSVWGLSQLPSFSDAVVKEIVDKVEMLGLKLQDDPEGVTEPLIVAVPEPVVEPEPIEEIVEEAKEVYARISVDGDVESEPVVEEVQEEVSHPDKTVGEVAAELVSEVVEEEPTPPKKSGFKQGQAKPRVRASRKKAVSPPVGGKRGLIFDTDLDKVLIRRTYVLRDVEVEVNEDGDFTELPYTEDMPALATILLAIDRSKKLFKKG